MLHATHKQRMRLAKHHTSELGFLWVAALIAGMLGPMYLISRSPEEFGYFRFGAFSAFSLLITAVFGVLGTLVYGVLAAVQRETLARSFVLFVLFWTAVTAFIFPVVQGGELVEAADLRVNRSNVVIALVFTIALVRLVFSNRFTTLPVVFLALLTPFTVVPAVPRLYQLSTSFEEKAKNLGGLLTLSNDNNVIVLSFDGVPGNVVREVFSQHIDLRSAFKDFVFFDEAIALAPATRESLTAELFGNRNYRELGDTHQEVLDELDLRGLPFNRAAEAGAAAFTYGLYGTFNLNLATRFDSGDIYGGNDADVMLGSTIFFEYAVARMATRHAVTLLRRVGLSRHIINALPARTSNELSKRLLGHAGPRWDLGLIRQKLDLDEFITSLRVGRSGTYVAYLHFLHTHFPVDFDQTCEYRSDEATWHLQHQSQMGITDEAVCALTQAARFIGRLKALGIYEKTFLVIKSDHGKPVTYYDEAPHNSRINRHTFLGLNRYRPLLMVKDRGRVAVQTEVVSDWVTLGDLSKTMCRQLLGDGSVCDPFPGVDLVGERDLRTNPLIYPNVVKDETSDFGFDTHETVELDRTRDAATFAELLKQTGRVKITAPLEKAQ